MEITEMKRLKKKAVTVSFRCPEDVYIRIEKLITDQGSRNGVIVHFLSLCDLDDAFEVVQGKNMQGQERNFDRIRRGNPSAVRI